MRMEGVKKLWERTRAVLAIVLGSVLIANAAVVLGKTTVGGIAVAAGLVVLAGLAALPWRITTRTTAGAVGAAALAFTFFGCLMGVVIGAITAIPPFEKPSFNDFDVSQAVMFGLISGGSQAWIRWVVFREMRRDQTPDAVPEQSA